MAKAFEPRAALVALLALAAMAALAFGPLRSDAVGPTDLEARLERVLSCVEGAGSVRVLINAQEGESSDGKEGKVIGVVIVSSGADNAATVARLAHAAGVALGLEQQYIEVFAMGEGAK